jgi:nucleotide-binding universal stress UspA family protein
MFDNILVGVDGRQGGRDAIALAKRLAAPGAAITLAHVYGSAWMMGRAARLAFEVAREEAQQMLAVERAEAGIEAKLAVYPLDQPGRALHEAAEHLHADLIVIGSTRHALLGRVLMGDDARASLNGAPCAVAIAPRGYTQMHHELAAVGVGYDGSAEAAHALTTARELPARYGARIKAAWVVSLQDVRDEAPLPADWPQETEALVRQCQDQLDQLDGVEAKATYGGPREELSRFGDEVDLLIVGSRSYGPIHRMFHGTTSTYLTQHIGCPLLALPRVTQTAGDPQSGRPAYAVVESKPQRVQAAP